MDKRDINAFIGRFNRWKNGEKVYDGGRVLQEIVVTPEANYTNIGEFNPNKYPVVSSKDEGLDDWFKSNTDVTGMAIGGGENGIDGQRRIVHNPYLINMENTDSKWKALDKIEAVRHYMSESNYYPTFNLTNELKHLQKTLYKNTPYGKDDVAFKRSIISRLVVGDENNIGTPTPQQLKAAKNFIYPRYKGGKDAGTITAPVLSVKAGDTVNTELCAEWANKWLRDNGYITYGNAWNLKNVDVLYNGYKGMKKPAEYDRKAIEKYNHAAADSVYKNFDSTTLDKSKPYSVNMFYNGSPAQERAYEQGDNVTGTHTGLLTFNPSQNKWYVTHNIHGTIHLDLFGPLQSGKGKYGVTAIYEPRENTTVNKIKGFFGFEDGKEGDHTYEGRTLPEVTVYPTTLTLRTHYPIISSYLPGHSLLFGYDGSTGRFFNISKRPNNAGYNFITNNCSDDTRKALEAATGNAIHPFLFTTPGDVQDFFRLQYPNSRERWNNGVRTLEANVSLAEFNKAKEVADSLSAVNYEKRRKDIEKWRLERLKTFARNSRK